ncbi:hypothetical protein AYX14_07077 [Cryptococcus neoformans]|nr:hypothetical protein AYX14_07077 [Cryptococcus neoformans var. grubii]
MHVRSTSRKKRGSSKKCTTTASSAIHSCKHYQRTDSYHQHRS